MGGTGRARRRKRAQELGTGLEHDVPVSEGAGQRNRIRRRRLAYQQEKAASASGGDFEVVGNDSEKKTRRRTRSGAGFSDENAKWLKPKGKSARTINDDEMDEDDGEMEQEVDVRQLFEGEAVGDARGEHEEDDEDEDGNVSDLIDDGPISEGEMDEDEEEDEEDAKIQRMQLDLGSDDSSVADDGEESGSDSDESEAPDNLELASKRILDEKKREEEQAEAEMEEIRQRAEAEEPDFRLEGGVIGRGGKDVEEEDEVMGATREELMVRIRGILHVLGDFKTRREEGKARSEYVEALKRSVCECFGYNEELAEMLMDVFPNAEIVDFMEASESPRPLTIRTNTLKTRRTELAAALISRGMNVEPIDKWSAVGLVVYDSQVPVGATPEYLAGHYMIQSASSFLPVVALAPRENERIVDLAAAPGGKATYIGAVMKNTGTLVANDLKRDRVRALVGNIHRLGVRNAVVCKYNGMEIGKVFGKCFDRALLDAPCSGTGIISHDESVKMNRRRKDLDNTTRIQKELLLGAIDCVNEKSKSGGYIVYSTCSVLVEENESVVDYALRKRDVKVVECGIGIGIKGFTKMKGKRFCQSLEKARRIYPHVHNLDGFFVCKLKKISDRKGEKDIEEEVEVNGGLDEEVEVERKNEKKNGIGNGVVGGKMKKNEKKDGSGVVNGVGDDKVKKVVKVKRVKEVKEVKKGEEVVNGVGDDRVEKVAGKEKKMVKKSGGKDGKIKVEVNEAKAKEKEVEAEENGEMSLEEAYKKSMKRQRSVLKKRGDIRKRLGMT